MIKYAKDVLSLYMSRISIWECLLIFVGCIIITNIICRFFIEKKIKFVLQILFAFYLSFVIIMVFLSRKFGAIENSFSTLFNTYKCFFKVKWEKYEIILNVIFFVPMGIFLKICFSNKKSIVLAFVCSLIIEIIQLLTNCGLFEICDLIHNTLGGFIGVLIYNLSQKIIIKIEDKKSGK